MKSALAFKETMTKVVKEPYEWHLQNATSEEVKGSLCARFTQQAAQDEEEAGSAKKGSKDIGRELAEWTAAVQFIGASQSRYHTFRRRC